MITVTLQLSSVETAGDWANRPASTGRRTATGELGARTRRVNARRNDQVAVYLSELRGGIESIKRGAFGPTMADSRTDFVDVEYGTPAMYSGMRFGIVTF
ncbi:MAG: hypothetical protein JWM25_380 [Thermoleophilia bacterium]|nr:hypothetical protein [Thermoleophilia bacterium]MCZ4495797.1 hypothetical protein [Thermoleophilia bacterium]